MNADSAELLRQAEVLHGQGQRLEAIALFRQALALHPESSEGWYELGYLLKAESQYEAALEAYAEALARGIARPEEVHLNRAVIYSDHLRRDEAAEQELKTALALAPGYHSAWLNLGNLHEERGQREAALECYDKILADPGALDRASMDLRMEALSRSANLRPPTTGDDPVFAKLQAAASQPAGKMARANVYFALGQARDRLGQYELAFEAYAKANRWLLRQSGKAYDRAHMVQLTSALIETFSDAAAEPLSAAPSGPEPLFICGMFRSGSTLLEQVLAAHPQVMAGGELNWLRQLATERLSPFPASMSKPDVDRDVALAAEYRAHLARLFPVASADAGVVNKYISDKRPDNFLLIGLIKQLFPSARIIHTTRNPLDNGLSIFMQHLHLQVAGYSADLGDIGHYYAQYRRLMAHWQSLYADSIFTFDYDAFVREPKPTLMRLLEFLQLPWDDRCLEFHRLRNTVKTGSYWQVRQPLHGKASGRWHHYEAHVADLQNMLRENGIIEPL
ncbi:MAG: sulfotransferase [Xanthomonadales bacterium]|nr:sulfotransferase [Xanthomonadales bacterium]